MAAQPGTKWGLIRFGESKFETKGDQHLFQVQIYFNDLDPAAVQVELYADGVKGADPVRQMMEKISPLAGVSGGYLYRGSVPASRPPADFTARALPFCEGVAVPLEESRILWQH